MFDYNPFDLIEQYGSPLYVYNEEILRDRCKKIKGMMKYENFKVNYSPKANSNIYLLKIINEEGLNVDAMSPGEIHVNLKAGFSPDNILYIGNNVSLEEISFAVEKGVKVSVDSLSQLELFGRHFPGHKVIVRFNGGIGAGHHSKVVTAGEETKFGVDPIFIPEMKKIIKKYNLRLIGINQHIGSLFLDTKPYTDGAKRLLEIAMQFDDLELVDFGGGFGVVYMPNENKLNIDDLGCQLDKIIADFIKDYGKKISVIVEPGRYIVCECGVLLGSIYSIKENYGNKYIGTDIGFNVLMRPILYNSYHAIEVYKQKKVINSDYMNASVVGNICESGDIIAGNRKIPEVVEGDIIGVNNAGAYGYSMCSNYNNRLRPAEILIDKNKKIRLIRKRDTFENLTAGFEIGHFPKL
ncbi:MAG: diaminopimelate decarboxylase [Desulfobacteraceae bacterium]|nr:diaminopimelate decarboxylase [Desulfobacteraceae bacterium]